MSKKLCIYHGNCADGFTAAWVVREALGEHAVDFHPGVYGVAPPDVTDREVIMVDFSYKRPVLEAMRDRAKSVLVLDHHKTAQEDLRDLPGVRSVFDMERSGAGIAWDYFFPDVERPQLVNHIEDRDLWRFALPRTRAIQAGVFSFEYDFTTWDWLMRTDLATVAREGEAIERKHLKDVRELIGVLTRRMVIGGHNVPVANMPYTHVSDAANQMAVGEPFAACYWDTERGRVFGLRSVEGGMDVSEIAKQYGGGGHKHAAGFTLPYAEAAKLEVA